MQDATPSYIMYSDLRSYAGISYYHAASSIVSSAPQSDGKSPRARISEKTYLSRRVVHAEPLQTPPLASNLLYATQVLGARIIYRKGKEHIEDVIEHYSSTAAHAMADALDAYHLSGQIYLNAVTRLLNCKVQTKSDLGLLLIMLFVLTGSKGNPTDAATTLFAFCHKQLGISDGTPKNATSEEPRTEQANTNTAHNRLGLLRIIDDMARPPIHCIEPDAAPTVLGTMPNGETTIADVERDVSRSHLKISCKNGQWVAEDLGSTNGTRLLSPQQTIDASGNPVQTIRDMALVAGEPVAVSNGDRLVLGADTCYLLLSLA